MKTLPNPNNPRFHGSISDMVCPRIDSSLPLKSMLKETCLTRRILHNPNLSSMKTCLTENTLDSTVVLTGTVRYQINLSLYL